jgi:hypothetical protein
MRALLAFLLLLAAGTSAVRPAITKNFKAVRNCGKPASAPASPSFTIADPAQDKLDAACAGDVGHVFKHDEKATIGQVNRGSLDCAALNLDPDMAHFDFQFHVSECLRAQRAFSCCSAA